LFDELLVRQAVGSVAYGSSMPRCPTSDRSSIPHCLAVLREAEISYTFSAAPAKTVQSGGYPDETVWN